MSTCSRDDLLVSLRVIGSIKANDRLYTKAWPIRVESWNYMQGISRWINGEKRSVNISSIQKCFHDAFAYVENGLMLEENYRQTFQTSSGNVPPNLCRERLENLQLLGSLKEALLVSLKGLVGLRVTYARDARVLASLDIIEQNVKHKLDQLTLSQNLATVMVTES